MPYNQPKPIHKSCEEDEYAAKRQHREREPVKARLNAADEWTSELPGEKQPAE